MTSKPRLFKLKVLTAPLYIRVLLGFCDEVPFKGRIGCYDEVTSKGPIGFYDGVPFKATFRVLS